MGLLRSAAIRFSHMIPASTKRRLKWQLMIPDIGATLENLKRKGFEPKVILDIGAYVGKWTTMSKEIWPDAKVCMFEPQPDKRSVLDGVMRQFPNVELRPTCLGEVPDTTVRFFLHESGSSTHELLEQPDLKPVELPSTTLSKAVAGTPFAAPDLIKVDVQGAELSVLRGGLDVLSRAQAVVLEVSVVDSYKGAPLFAEVIRFMDEHGFVASEIGTIWRNCRSESMKEVDIIFIRKDSTLLDQKHYSMH